MSSYYLISSLPMLKHDADPPLSYDKFIEACRDAVSVEKLKVLENLSVNDGEGPLLREWAKFYSNMKNELTYKRNLRLGKKTPLPDATCEKTSKVIDEALNAPNPMEAEDKLLALQFEKIDELIGVHYFDDHALMGYAIKLLLLERKQSFKKDAGKKEMHRIIEHLEQQIISME